MDERTLVSMIAGYVNNKLNVDGFQAGVEEHISHGSKRFDLLVKYKGKNLYNGEFKRPTTLEGRNPKNINIVEDANFKSANSGTNFFVTSNFNDMILWDNRDPERPLMTRDVETLYLEKRIKVDDDFNDPDIRKSIEESILKITQIILNLYQNKIKSHYKALGDSFIEGLNAHLNDAAEIATKYVPTKILQKWWKEQQYEPVGEFGYPEKLRISKFSLYVLANKIVFYYVLRKTFSELPDIHIPEDIADIKSLQNIVESAFEKAKDISGDYETVFEISEADNIPFMNNDLVYPIHSLIKFFYNYNISSISQDTLGNIYDRLISTKERHDNGQYYTPIPVVDLINALVIRDKDDVVLDPACGSGTFLTRAFDLKLNLYEKDGKKDSKETMEKLLESIFGVDIAAYPAHLATVALASKLLTANPNVYPKIVKNDFLNIKPDMVVPRFRLTKTKHSAKDLGGQDKIVSFKPIDAVVGNLPYIRQELIPNKEKEQEKVTNFLSVSRFGHYEINNTSDFHAYFWYYILPFLKEGSRIGFLTSDTWLNVDYGNDLKKFLNKYFKIVAIIDSSVERWFEDALVNTFITILERTDVTEDIKNNKIKFVRINRKLSELIPDINAAKDIAGKIERGKKIEGITLMREIKQGDIDFNDLLESKMFPYLRAPDEFFELVKSNTLTSLKNIMNVNFGIKTGANEFFYVDDVTDNYSASDLKRVFGLSEGDKKELRVVEDGTGEQHIIEKEYLKPILKSPKEFTKEGLLIFNKPTKKFVVLITDENKTNVKKNALEYLKYGERNPKGDTYANRETCKGRSPWWKLSPIIYPDMVFPRFASSTFIYPNAPMLVDASIYFGKLNENHKNDILAVSAFMNSSLSYLYTDMYGRNYGGGGAPVEFKVYEINLLPVPKPEILRPYYKKINKIMKKLEKRRIGNVFEEIWDLKDEFDLNMVKKDRLELDRVILKALGFKNPDVFLKEWYKYLVKIVIERLEKAASFSVISSSKKRPLNKVAEDIINNLGLKPFPDGYVIDGKVIEKISIPNSADISYGNDLKGFFLKIDKQKRYFVDISIPKYLYYCAKRGIYDVSVPKNVKDIMIEFERDKKEYMGKLKNEINDITDNEKVRRQLYSMCISKLGYI